MQIHRNPEKTKGMTDIKSPCFLLNSQRQAGKANRPQNFDKLIHLSTIRL